MTSISDKENQLFEKWQENRDGFVRDGGVSEKAFLESDPRLVFVLKEVNDIGGGGWDLREFVSKGGRRQTWNNIARWVHGIRNIDALPDWDFYADITDEFRVQVLRTICALNLKKSPGTHTTDRASFEVAVKEDAEMIKRQCALYDADLTICGGTGDWFRWVMGHVAPWRMTRRGIWWYEREPEKYVISFSHPEARVQDSILVYSLLDAVREIYA